MNLNTSVKKINIMNSVRATHCTKSAKLKILHRFLGPSFYVRMNSRRVNENGKHLLNSTTPV